MTVCDKCSNKVPDTLFCLICGYTINTIRKGNVKVLVDSEASESIIPSKDTLGDTKNSHTKKPTKKTSRFETNPLWSRKKGRLEGF